MSAFMDTMDQTAGAAGAVASAALRRGENGAAEYTSGGVGDPRVSLFFGALRTTPDGRLAELVGDVLRAAEELGAQDGGPQVVADLVVLAFQTRNARGGKGERDLFYKMLVLVAQAGYVRTACRLVGLIPKYGYFKDLLRLTEMVDIGVKGEAAKALRGRALRVLARQLIKDHQELCKAAEEGRKPRISLAGKYAPRKGKHFAKGACKASFDELVALVCPTSVTAKADYRRLVSALTRALDVPEVLMCAGRYGELDFERQVPSVCLKKFRRAFLNELVPTEGTKGKTTLALAVEEAETGNRRPLDPDRVACRAHLLATAKEKKVKGGQVYPHELVEAFLERGHEQSASDRQVLCAQWEALREAVQRGLAEAQAEPKAEAVEGATSTAVDLGRVVALVDVSGSMSGTPMAVAIALGILASELAAPAFRHRFLTFSATPTWVSLANARDLADKVAVARQAPWGMNTDFGAALELILDAAAKAKLAPEDVPSLLVLSDMQFDQASYGTERWETQHERLVRRFAEVGRQAVGRPYQVPTITYWNLRGDTAGFPAQASTPGVQMLAGFSPSLLKALVGGQEVATVVTPYGTLRQVLDDAQYDPVRAVLSASNEGLLAGYTYQPQPTKGRPEGQGEGGEGPVAMDEGDEDGADWEVL
jgi:Mg-chelatase subunit ChlD